MCEYVKQNQCSLTNDICPFVYWCDRLHIWKPSKAMPEICNVKKSHEVPKGYYRVRQERKGYLYVDIDEITYKFKNIFDDVPEYVKVTKTKNGWKLKK